MQNIFKLFFIILLVTLFYSCSHSYDEKFSIEPSSLTPGNEITVYYNPSGTDLEGVDEIQLVAYSFNNELIGTEGYEMTRDGNGYLCKFSTDKEAGGIIIKFSSDKEEKSDNNENEGYLVKLKSPEADAGYAVALSSWGYNLDMDNNREKALEIFDNVFKEKPELLKDFAGKYFNIVWRIKGEDKINIINEKIQKLEELNDNSEEVLSTLVTWYKNIGNQSKADEYGLQLSEMYPANSVVEMDKFREARSESNLDEKLKLAEQFKKDFPGSDLIGDLYYYVLEDFRKAGKTDEGLGIIKSDPSLPHLYVYTRYINYFIEKKEYAKALELAELELDVTQKEVDNPEGERPNDMTALEWAKSRKSNLGTAFYHGAEALRYSSKLIDALVSAERACTLLEGDDVDANQLYTQLLFENAKYEECLDKLKEFIVAGNSSSDMKDLLKNAYVKVNNSNEGFDAFKNDLEEQAMAEIYDKLKDEMLDEPAPQFELTDLSGNKVALVDLKGKTVVVDFWATWCGPCRQSFPGMKIAIEKFKDNENVEFLFVNSWERVDNKLENATNFINENNYPFHVIMDTENSVITSFKVSGIPTKFVIGPKGNIRFKAVGFDGNTDKVADEVSAMIKLASQS